MMHLPELHLESARHIGVIRPLNGVNLSPAAGASYVDAYAELNAACARMHDAPLNCAGRELIDISRIFPLFHLDHHDPKNYWFKETDSYLQQCIDTGTPIYYRLGESIEHHPVKCRVNPPPDFRKWAEICEHVIAHYNEGWADGFHFDIRYWEIWNEPDTTSMWTGTEEQFFELYITASKYLKQRFPDIKIGGPGHIGKRPEPMRHFLQVCREADAPLDFYSWHCYSCNIEYMRDQVQQVREAVDSFGYTKTELHLNEWHYAPCSWSKPAPSLKPMVYDHFMKYLDSAAFTAAVLTVWQDTPLDMSCFYTGLSRGFGIFTLYGEITKTYCALKAFGIMTRHPHRLAIDHDPDVYALAGEDDDGEIAVLLSVFRIMGAAVTLHLDFEPAEAELFSVDIASNLDPVELPEEAVAGNRITVPVATKPSVHLLKLRRNKK